MSVGVLLSNLATGGPLPPHLPLKRAGVMAVALSLADHGCEVHPVECSRGSTL